ncbi:hypothetical protein NSTC745_04587 [Nostoc sp. DSM 114161]
MQIIKLKLYPFLNLHKYLRFSINGKLFKYYINNYLVDCGFLFVKFLFFQLDKLNLIA